MGTPGVSRDRCAAPARRVVRASPRPAPVVAVEAVAAAAVHRDVPEQQAQRIAVVERCRIRPALANRAPDVADHGAADHRGRVVPWWARTVTRVERDRLRVAEMPAVVVAPVTQVDPADEGDAVVTAPRAVSPGSSGGGCPRRTRSSRRSSAPVALASLARPRFPCSEKCAWRGCERRGARARRPRAPRGGPAWGRPPSPRRRAVRRRRPASRRAARGHRPGGLRAPSAPVRSRWRRRRRPRPDCPRSTRCRRGHGRSRRRGCRVRSRGGTSRRAARPAQAPSAAMRSRVVARVAGGVRVAVDSTPSASTGGNRPRHGR